jgi:hypothetical protein
MLNPLYLSRATLAQARSAFRSNKELPSITLQKFLDEKASKQLRAEVAKASFRKKVDKMHYSYATAPLTKRMKALLKSPELLNCVSSIVGMQAISIEGELCTFGWRDYTLLHDEKVERSGVDVLLDFTGQWREETGGKLVYVDGTGSSHHIPALPNALSITFRKEGVQKFVQYVNHKAGKGKRILFIGKVT